MRKFKSVLALLLALVLVLGCVGTAFAAKTPVSELEGASKGDAADAKGFKSVEFQANLNKYNDDDVVRAIVVLKDAPTAALAKRGAANEASVRAQVKASQDKVRKAMRGIDYEVQYTYDTLLNGFSCDVAYGDLDKIAAIDGVDAVYIANHYAAPVLEKGKETRMSTSNSWMTGVEDAWDYFEVDGSGMVIAVLDTGLNTTHEAFQDADGVCADTGRLTAADAALATVPGKYINAKVPFAYDYADRDDDVTDSRGHGTHVSGIAAGCTYDAEEGSYSFQGAAPHAQIVSMKIFKDGVSGTSSDIYFYALEDAYRLGVDVVNMSIGAQNGFTYDASLESVVFGNIYKRLSAAGIVLSVAAGNEYSMAQYSSMGYIGPEYQDYGTVASPSTYIGSTAVASVENLFYPAYVVRVGDGRYTYTDTCTEEAKTWLNAFGDKEVEYVVVPDAKKVNEKSEIGLGSPEDFAATDVKGKIAVVQRGSLSFEEKVENAANAGAIGCIVVNNDATMLRMSIETFEVPAICVEVSAVDAFLNAETKTVTTPKEKQKVLNAQGGLMSDFSNWGTSPMLTMAPVITSVGGQVYSSVQTGDHDYDVYSGTSMAAPNFAGTVSLVLQYLKEQDESLTKSERAEKALALLESTAMVLTDEDNYPYSVRKQGAGLTDVFYALSNYTVGAYVSDPIKELGDDAEKKGVYEFDVTLTNESNQRANYYPSSALLCDYVVNYYQNDPSKKPLYLNTLTENIFTLGEDYTASYSVNGQELDGTSIVVESGKSTTVHVKLTLTDDVKAYFDQMFPNGNYIDGYVYFYETRAMADGTLVYFDADDNAYALDETGAYLLTYDENDNFVAKLDGDGKKTYYTGDEADLSVYVDEDTANHATLLTFYGDWTKGSAMESADFRDYLTNDYLAKTTVANAEGKTYADLGYSGFDFIDYYTMPNMAYLITRRGQMRALSFPGANALVLNDWAEPVEYMEEHIAMSTLAYKGGYNWTYELYMLPQLLRNASHLVMTVRDKDTGELYYKDDTPYINKSYYDDDDNAWSGMSSFSWDGKDASGAYVPSGTVAHVQFNAQLPYNDTVQEALWEFDITVDYTAPKLESVVYDKDAKTLTVTASDEQYLQGIYIGTTSRVLQAEAFSSDKKGASFTATFDVAELQETYDYLSVVAIDYATNETEVVAPLFDSGKDVKVTVVSATGTEVHEMKSGDTFVIPAAEDYEEAQFQLWGSNPVEKAETAKDALAACGKTYQPGDEVLLKSDLTIYAVYAYGKIEPLETTNYWYDENPDDYSGEWALAGLDYDLEAGKFLTDTPYVLDSALAKKNVVADFGAKVGEEYVEFFTNEKSIRWVAEKLEDGTYTIKNVVTGEYLASDEYGLDMVMLKEVTAFAKWKIKTNAAYGATLENAGATGTALVYDNDEGIFTMMDNTFDFSYGVFDDPMYAGDLYPIFMYRAADEEFVISYYTTEYCKHSGGKATCLSPAICENCGQPYGEKDPDNHAGEAVWTRTETTHEYKYECCGVVVVAEEAHEWDENGVCTECGYGCEHTGGTATCTERAVCENCGQKYGDLNPDNHSGKVVWTYAKATHIGKYDCCGAVAVAKEPHEWEDGVCTECGYACRHGDTEIKDAKEATYEEDGYSGDTWCKLCGKMVNKGEVIPATGYPACSFKNFKDCDSKWYHEAVDYTVANGLMKGLSSDTFDPDGTMTRAMMVTVLYRMAGSPEVKGNSTFTDVPAGQWYSDAIAWAQDNGIVLGVLTDKFAPNDFVTREQIATILWRYEGKPAAESKFDGFKDADKISDYAKEAMAWAVSEGIFNGDNGNLKPTDNATRAEFACIVMRYLDGSYACKDLVK